MWLRYVDMSYLTVRHVPASILSILQVLAPKGNPTVLLVSTCPPINSSHPQDKSSSDEFPSHNLRELVRKAFRSTQDLPYLRTPSKDDGLLQLCKLLTFSTNRFEIRIDSILLALQQQVADVFER